MFITNLMNSEVRLFKCGQLLNREDNLSNSFIDMPTSNFNCFAFRVGKIIMVAILSCFA